MTPTLGLLLTTCILTAAPAKEDDPAARAQATLQRVSKLPPDHQRVWLRLVEQRYAWAVLLTMKPEDAKGEQARVAKILRQKTVGWNDLVTLLRQLDQREKAAIARLVRQYRSEVYDTFRKRPQDLVDRQEAWYRIWSAWEKSGSPPEQQDRLMDWLADAIKASNKDAIGRLPADPKFGSDVELVPEQLVKQLTQPPAAKPAESKAAERHPAEESLPRPELQARAPLPLRIVDPRGSVGVMKLPAEAIVARRIADRAATTLPQETPPAVVPPLHALPAVAPGDAERLTALPAPTHYAAVLVIRRESLPVVESAAEMVAKTEPGAAKPQALNAKRQASQTPPSRSIESPPPEQPVTAPATVALSPRVIVPAESGLPEVENPRASAPREDLSAPLPRPLAEVALARQSDYRVNRKPLEPGPASPSQPAPQPAAEAEQHARVNVEELGTRIEGINLALRNLEGELNEKREFTTDQLGSLLSRLDILVLRQKDLTLFRDLITPQEQAKVGQIDSSRSVVATMGTRIAEQRTRIRGNESLPEAERTAALKQLDELSERLATLTAEK